MKAFLIVLSIVMVFLLIPYDDAFAQYKISEYVDREKIMVYLNDLDGDGIKDLFDNCDKIKNYDQKDTDGDNIGDVCDSNTFVDYEIKFDFIPNQIESGTSHEMVVSVKKVSGNPPDVKLSCDYGKTDPKIKCVFSPSNIVNFEKTDIENKLKLELQIDESITTNKQHIVFIKGEIEDFTETNSFKFNVPSVEEPTIEPFFFTLNLEPSESEVTAGESTITKIELVSESEIQSQVKLSCESDLLCEFPNGDIISKEKNDAILKVHTTNDVPLTNFVTVVGHSLDSVQVKEIELFFITVNPIEEVIPRISLKLDSEEEIIEKGGIASTKVVVTSNLQTDADIFLLCEPRDICEISPKQVRANGTPAKLEVTPINYDKNNFKVTVNAFFKNELQDFVMFNAIINDEEKIVNGSDNNNNDKETGGIFDRIEQLAVIMATVIAAIAGIVGIIYKVRNKPVSQK